MITVVSSSTSYRSACGSDGSIFLSDCTQTMIALDIHTVDNERATNAIAILVVVMAVIP